MKLAYVTTYNARDRKNWSGLGYYMGRALEYQVHSVEYVGPLPSRNRWVLWAKKQAYAHILRQRYLPDREPWLVRHQARQAAKRLSRLNVDVVFSPGTIPVAYLESDRPIVVWTDSSFAGVLDFYPEFSNLCRETRRHGSELEAMALGRAALVVYSSDWAARVATQTYGLAGGKVHVVPFGANLETAPTPETVREMVNERSSRVCNLLFIAIGWYRKGGDVAVEVARSLNNAGLPTQLFVVGSRPCLRGRTPDFVQYLGRIGASSPTRLSRLQAVMAKSHFFVLPSRADCTPVVFSEANAFGVPCLASRVGGIASIIRDGVNGATFEPGASVANYCEYISNHFVNAHRYRELALSSFREYESRLNWSVAGRTVTELMSGITV